MPAMLVVEQLLEQVAEHTARDAEAKKGHKQ